MDARTMNETISSPDSRLPFKHVLAFDVSKATLVTRVLPSGQETTIENTRAAVRRLIQKEMKTNAKLSLGPLLVICEATGSYDRHIRDVADEQGVACHRAHGSRMRAYAKYRGKRAKTDPIDVRMIADFGRDTPDLVLWRKPTAAQEELRALVSRRSELDQALSAERARVEHVKSQVVGASLRRHIKTLEKEIEGIEAALEKLVAEVEQLDTDTKLMRSVVGVGFITAASLLAYIPELGTIGRGAVAAVAGLAPYDDASGEHDGVRRIAGGRLEARHALYMAAVVAIRSNPHLKDLAHRVKASGKPSKVAITAVMRKLLTILNAIVRDGKPCKMPSAARQPKNKLAKHPILA
jgi:transposase